MEREKFSFWMLLSHRHAIIIFSHSFLSLRSAFLCVVVPILHFLLALHCGTACKMGSENENSSSGPAIIYLKKKRKKKSLKNRRFYDAKRRKKVKFARVFSSLSTRKRKVWRGQFRGHRCSSLSMSIAWPTLCKLKLTRIKKIDTHANCLAEYASHQKTP